MVSSDQALAHQILLNNQARPHPYDMTLLQKWLVDVRGGDCQLRGPGSTTWFPPELGGRPKLDYLTIASTGIRADYFSILGRRYFGKVIKWVPFLRVTVSIQQMFKEKRVSFTDRFPETKSLARGRNSRLCTLQHCRVHLLVWEQNH